ncbi:MAG: DUF262 domain-containing protein, partial [Candidatus Neomarinimicrobiota bacterium]|nr:DUF262 domain-containing protein [Candidatus Neomarinimicrobiota bacterium]
MKINQILIKIDEKQLFVPAFQREYVWRRADAKNLISSLIKDYPTGTMLTWETNHPPEIKGDHKYDPKQGSVKLILDGQQRITTLYILMTGRIPPYYKKDDITHNIKSLCVNIENLELEYYKKNMMSNNPLWIHITDIFKGVVRKRDVVDKLEKNMEGERISRKLENVLDDNFLAIQKINDKDFKEQVVPTQATVKEAIDIFYIVNASGVNLTDAELALAQISGYWPEARALFKEKLKKLAENGFVFKLDFIIYVLLGIVHNAGSKMEKLHNSSNKDKVREVWQKLDTEILDYVFNILKSQAYIDHTKEVNSVYAFVPIIVYAFNKGKNLSQLEIKKMVKWFYYSQIRFRYISQLGGKLDKDLTIIINEENPFDKLLNLIALERNLEIMPNEFEGVGVLHPLWGIMKFYFKSNNAVCFSTGINIRKNMGKKYDLEWDHIFPYSILKKNGYDMNNRIRYQFAQEITNRAVLTAVANRAKSAENADSYLSQVRDQFPNSLKLQCIPEDENLWKLENFELLLKARRQLLADEINNYLENITETAQDDLKMDLYEMISAGENNLVEFKTTFRYDLKTGAINKRLEQVILRAIAAFSNAEGGTLIMGVNDELDIVGLEHDYQTLNNGTKDEFELHLRNVTNNAYGIDFSSTNIEVSFPIVEDTEICVVDIKPWHK